MKKQITRQILAMAAGLSLLAGCGGGSDNASPALEVVAQWDRVQYDLGDAVAEKAYNDTETYKKVLMQGVQVDAQGNLYVSTARWGGKDVPATLSKLVKQADGRFKLQPYPSKAFNDVTNPAGIKAVLGFAIDRNNILWMLDQGHVDGVPTSSRDEKLIGWDITNNVEKYRIEFPDGLYDKTCSFLNDVVVDNDNGFVYISDSGIRCDPLKGALMVYDYTNNTVRRLLDGDVLTQDEAGFTFKIHGRSVLKNGAMRTGADGIALSGDKKTLYWTNLTGNNLYSVPTALLRDRTTPESTIRAAVKAESIPSNTDGLTADRNNNVYLTALTMNGVLKRDAATGAIAPLFTSDEISWADTLAWGPDGALYVLSNHLHLWVDGDMNFATPNTVPNFRIYRYNGTIGTKPYTAP
jgi:sugar lactone lactonase YvrE